MVASHDEATAEMADNLGRAFLDFCADRNIDVVDSDEAQTPPRICASWSQSRGFGEERLPAFARQADLVVIARAEKQESSLSTRMEEALIARSACPVLLAPAAPASTLPGHPVIAWNGSREAALAVSQALPFLEHAGKVTVVSVGELTPHVPTAADLAVSLKRQGINADHQHLEKPSGGVLETLTQVTADVRGDMLIMGAYSHSQWREVILGGVTRQILKASDLPVLLSH